MVGAEWWNLPPAFSERKHLGKEQYACATLEECFEPNIKNYNLIAWPENHKVVCYASNSRDEDKDEVDLTKYYNSMDMRERCGFIRDLGGEWCSCNGDCPGLNIEDWSHWDPGDRGCRDAPSIMMESGEKYPGLKLVETEEGVVWANEYCARKGWTRPRTWQRL